MSSSIPNDPPTRNPMHVWNGLDSIDAPVGPSSVAVGMFDGIHRGHQALISRAVADARTHGRAAVVLTFDRHPAELIDPEKAPGYLTTHAQRTQLFESLGADHLVIARFNSQFRDLSPETFLRFVLKGVLQAKAVFVGFDFRFGRGHEGDVHHIQDARERLDLEVHVLEPILIDGEKASSSRVRQLLRDGNLEGAFEVLGHPYVLEGIVVGGQKLGREIGYPTANIELNRAQVIPADGIYAVWVTWRNRRFKGACSIGIRPTIGGTERTIEVFMLDFDGDLYGETLELAFVERLRDETKFDSLETLKQQIAKDVAQVDSLLTVDRDRSESVPADQ